jgi:hypothetical protein
VPSIRTFAKLKAKEAAKSAKGAKRDIASWISSASASTADVDDMDSDGLSAADFVWQRERVADDWTEALGYAYGMLLSSKTSSRVQFLQEELVPLAQHEGACSSFRLLIYIFYALSDLSLSQTLDLFKVLTLTYPRYVDSPSRDGVEAVGVELVRRDETRGDKIGVTEQIISWIATEAARIAKMPRCALCDSI